MRHKLRPKPETGNTRRGRPRTRFGPEEHAQIEDMASNGHSKASMAKHFNLDPGTFAAALEKDAKAQAAFERGMAAERQKIEGSLLTQAANPGCPRSVQAANTLLKVRHGVEDKPAVQINVNIPAPLSQDKFKDVLATLEPVAPERPAIEQHKPKSFVEQALDALKK